MFRKRVSDHVNSAVPLQGSGPVCFAGKQYPRPKKYVPIKDKVVPRDGNEQLAGSSTTAVVNREYDQFTSLKYKPSGTLKQVLEIREGIAKLNGLLETGKKSAETDKRPHRKKTEDVEHIDEEQAMMNAQLEKLQTNTSVHTSPALLYRQPYANIMSTSPDENREPPISKKYSQSSLVNSGVPLLDSRHPQQKEHVRAKAKVVARDRDEWLAGPLLAAVLNRKSDQFASTKHNMIEKENMMQDIQGGMSEKNDLLEVRWTSKVTIQKQCRKIEEIIKQIDRDLAEINTQMDELLSINYEVAEMTKEMKHTLTELQNDNAITTTVVFGDTYRLGQNLFSGGVIKPGELCILINGHVVCAPVPTVPRAPITPPRETLPKPNRRVPPPRSTCKCFVRRSPPSKVQSLSSSSQTAVVQKFELQLKTLRDKNKLPRWK